MNHQRAGILCLCSSVEDSLLECLHANISQTCKDVRQLLISLANQDRAKIFNLEKNRYLQRY